MPTNPHQFGDLVPYGDPSWYRNYNRRVDAAQDAMSRCLRRCCFAARCADGSARSPYYTASHRAFRDNVRAFVDAEVTPNCDAWDRVKAIPRDLFAKAFAAGLLPGVVGPPWPVAYAGAAPEVRPARRSAKASPPG